MTTNEQYVGVDKDVVVAAAKKLLEHSHEIRIPKTFETKVRNALTRDAERDTKRQEFRGTYREISDTTMIALAANAASQHGLIPSSQSLNNHVNRCMAARTRADAERNKVRVDRQVERLRRNAAARER